MAHVTLTTSYQSLASLGPKRRFVLQTTDADCVVSIRNAVSTGDSGDGIEIGELTFKKPTNDPDEMQDGAIAVKYVLKSGTVTGAVWVDADAAPSTVAVTAYTPADAADYDAAVTTAAAAADQIAQRLRDVEVGVKSAQTTIPIDILGALLLATGAPMAVFANATSSVPGVQVTNSKVASVRWNDNATPGAIVCTVVMPQDLDDAQDVVFHALCSKIGATVGDATKLTVGAFEQVVGALHDADTDMGGETGALTGNATSKTVAELTLVLDKANIHASPGTITFTIKPKDGTLGIDDFCLHAAWLEITPKLLTS